MVSCWKSWRPPKRFFKYVFLFLLGILTCLVTLQLLESNFLAFSSDLNESPVYYSVGEGQSSPCDLKVKGQGHDLIPSYYEEVISVNRHETLASSETAAQHSPHEFHAIRTSINRFGITNPKQSDITKPKQAEDDRQAQTVWVVTPTFYRPEQRPELTRLAQALLPVSSFVHWIVVDDISQGSERSLEELKAFLQRFRLTFTLLKSLPPQESKIIGKPRGVGGRRAAIAWLRQFVKEGVVYFADDDNTYDSDIFRQMRSTKKVSMWPVGLVTSLGVSSPIVKNGKVVGFYDGWKGHRKFPVDMAGFAINMKLFLDKPNANMPWVAGYEEDELLKTLGVSIHDIVPLANDCTEILVWHTKTLRNSWPTQPKNFQSDIEANTNLKSLLKWLPQKAFAGPASSTKSVGSDDFSILKFFFGGS